MLTFQFCVSHVNLFIVKKYQHDEIILCIYFLYRTNNVFASSSEKVPYRNFESKNLNSLEKLSFQNEDCLNAKDYIGIAMPTTNGIVNLGIKNPESKSVEDIKRRNFDMFL